jgi:hypothetical protein
MRISLNLTKIEVTLGPGGNLSPVGTNAIRAFVGLAPFGMRLTDVVLLRDRFGDLFRTRPDRDVEAGEYVELVVEECISDRRSGQEACRKEILT